MDPIRQIAGRNPAAYGATPSSGTARRVPDSTSYRTSSPVASSIQCVAPALNCTLKASTIQPAFRASAACLPVARSIDSCRNPMNGIKFFTALMFRHKMAMLFYMLAQRKRWIMTRRQIHPGFERSRAPAGDRARFKRFRVSCRAAPNLVNLRIPISLTVPIILMLPWCLGCRPPRNSLESTQAASTPAPRLAARDLTEDYPEVTRGENGRLQWPLPRTADRQAERDRMVRNDIGVGAPFRDGIKDERVLAAMRTVPRHEFVPRIQQSRAYDDTPLPIGQEQTISQPFIVALMTELLELREGDVVLEIGTGSGYQAAVLNELTPYVFSIEYLQPLCEEARSRLERLGYRTIRVRCGDGYEGWPEYAPFDGIIVTCAAERVPTPLWEQLRTGGRMVIPIGGEHEIQRLVVLTKEPDGTRARRDIIPVRFVPMTGEARRP